MSLSKTSSSFSLPREQFNLFHAIDRELYTILVSELMRDPLESVQVIAFWLWLEKVGFRNVVKKILVLPQILIKELADEAVICLNCIMNSGIVYSDELNDIPLTQNIMEKEISLQIIQENQLIASQGVAKVVNDVCVKALADIMQRAIQRNAAQKLAEEHLLMSASNHSFFSQTGFAQLGFTGVADMTEYWGHEDGVPPENRTMFVTFSKGYPVAGWEVQDFFNRTFGNCVESLYMQEVKPNEQALFARIVFFKPAAIDVILQGVEKVKFTINGKHVWVRKFVPKRPRATL